MTHPLGVSAIIEAIRTLQTQQVNVPLDMRLSNADLWALYDRGREIVRCRHCGAAYRNYFEADNCHQEPKP